MAILTGVAGRFRDLPGIWRLKEPARAVRDFCTLPIGKVIVEMEGSFKMALRPRADWLEKQMFLKRTYEPATLVVFERFIRANSTVVDVGANLGLMTLKAASLVGPGGRVVSFEPSPEIYPRLLENIHLNKLTNIEPQNLALGAEPGELPLYHDREINFGGTSLVPTKKSRIVAQKVNVDTLDNILNGRRADFIKIDVEGFEGSVIAGAINTIKQFTPIIMLEFIRNKVTPDGNCFSAFDYLMDLGDYKCFKFSDSKFLASSTLVPVKNRENLPEEDNILFLTTDVNP